MYLGPGGDEEWARVAEQGRRASQYVASMMFQKLKGLEVLWIGDDEKAEVVRTVCGGIAEIVWSTAWRPMASVN